VPNVGLNLAIWHSRGVCVPMSIYISVPNRMYFLYIWHRRDIWKSY